MYLVPYNRQIIVKHSDVSEFLMNGADLMLPGLATTTSELLAARTFTYLLNTVYVTYLNPHLLCFVYTLCILLTVRLLADHHISYNVFCVICIHMRYIDLDGLMKGERVCIRVLGNPMPFAVGDSQVSYETIITYGKNTLILIHI